MATAKATAKVPVSFAERIRKIERNPHAQPEDLRKISKQAGKNLVHRKSSKPRFGFLTALIKGAILGAIVTFALLNMTLIETFLTDQIAAAPEALAKALTPHLGYIPMLVKGLLGLILVIAAYVLRRAGGQIFFVLIGAVAGYVAIIGPDAAQTQAMGWYEYATTNPEA